MFHENILSIYSTFGYIVHLVLERFSWQKGYRCLKEANNFSCDGVKVKCQAVIDLKVVYFAVNARMIHQNGGLQF